MLIYLIPYLSLYIYILIMFLGKLMNSAFYAA